MSLDYRDLPEHIQDGMQRYIEHHIPPGGFLTAVLENNLKEAYLRADIVNQQRLFDIVTWLYNYAPAGCWGSIALVHAWLNPP